MNHLPKRMLCTSTFQSSIRNNLTEIYIIINGCQFIVMYTSCLFYLNNVNRNFQSLFLSGGASVVFSTYLVKEAGLGPKGLKCTLCGKTGTDRSNLKKHVENIHFPGTLNYSCKYCSEIFITRNNLNHHISKHHKGPGANIF